jgi:hypothetical protein
VLLGVIAPLLLAEPIGRALGRASPMPIPWRMPREQTLLGAGLLALILGARLIAPQPRVDDATAPITALAHVPAPIRAQPVLNAYDFGGYLIFEGVKPYIDGRADMYGDNFITDDNLIQNGSQAAMGRAVADYRIRWAIVQPALPLVGALERMPGWRVLYSDRYAVVLTSVPPPATPPRPSSPPPKPAPPSSAHG